MSQAAIKKDHPSGEYSISLVPSERLSLIWSQVEKYLKKSASRSNGRARTEDIFHDLLNNKTNLWIIYDTGDLSISGVQITLFNKYPTGKKMLCLEHTAGRNMQEWVEKGIEILVKFAKENQCVGIEGIGRHGQWHWIKNKKGGKRPASFYVYYFEDGV